MDDKRHKIAMIKDLKAVYYKNEAIDEEFDYFYDI